MRIIFIAFISILLFSCQKELEDTGGGGSGGTPSQKLVRIGIRSGADTSTTDINYNSSGKIIRQYISGTSQGSNFFVEIKFNRNISGILTSLVFKSDQFASLGLDSLVTQVKYNSGSGRYIGKLTVINIFGFTLRDSSVFTYDGSGKITLEESYSSNPTSGIYQKDSKKEFTYLANGNVGNEKQYSFDLSASAYTLVAENIYQYDAKVNPLQLGVEAIFVSDMVQSAINNPSKVMYTDPADATNNQTMDLTYTYNTTNKPATSVTTVSPGGAVTTSRFFYQ